jgi:hypothetical protein
VVSPSATTDLTINAAPAIERAAEDQVHRLTDETRRQHQHGCHDESSLDRRADANREHNVHLVPAGEHRRSEQIGHRADQRQHGGYHNSQPLVLDLPLGLFAMDARKPDHGARLSRNPRKNFLLGMKYLTLPNRFPELCY